MDTDEEWAVRIRNLKFESFNQEWLDVVSTPAGQVRGPWSCAGLVQGCAQAAATGVDEHWGRGKTARERGM